MYTSLFTVIALALFSAPFVSAFEEIDANYTIVAGKETTIQIVNDLSRGPQSFDSAFDSYRVYLSITPPGWGSGPACYLVNSSNINVTSVNVQIPASVGPSDSSTAVYSIATMEFNQDPSSGGSSGFQYSNNFNFVGGTGNWSEYELSGHSIGNFDFIPCSAYDCARQCSQKYYPANIDSADAYKTTYNCIAQCPGVSEPPFDSIYGGSGGGGSGGGSSASTSITSLAAAGGFTEGTSLPTSTGSRSTLATAGGSTLTSSNTKASATSSSSGTLPASLTTGASTPTSSKSAASMGSSSQLAVLAASLNILASLLKL